MQEYPDKPNSEDPVSVARVVSENREILEALREILDDAQGEVTRLGIPCRACGNCCDFARMDHRLFVSTAELALLASVPPPKAPAKLRCPYQQNSLCTARQRRPLGCRIFFCNPSAQEKLRDLYETYHQRISNLHCTFDIPYAYGELTAWLEGFGVEF